MRIPAPPRAKKRAAPARSKVQPARATPHTTRLALWLSLWLALITIAVYAGVWDHAFVSFDDPDYISENAMVLAGLTWRGIGWAFTTGHAGNWHPLTWVSHMLDVQLFGAGAGANHVVNLALHVTNTLLLFGFLQRTTRAIGRSAFVAALFAVHPTHVESVAWASERKDVLSTLFWMLTLWAYVSYVRRPKPWRYTATLALFSLGLMAKPMVVTLPCVLLLLDWWPLGRVRHRGDSAHAPSDRWRGLLLEKIPFFALSMASSVVTFFVQRHAGAVSGINTLPVVSRIENAIVAYATYIGKMLWPTRLAAIYPYVWNKPAWLIQVSALVLVGISVFVLLQHRRRPYLAVGWLFFLGTLVPTIGLVQVGVQATADRYTYIPFIGLFIMIVWGLSDLVGDRLGWLVPALAASSVVTACGVTARFQMTHWENSRTLWQHAVDVSPDNAHALSPLGDVLKEQGNLDEAIKLYEHAIRIEPSFAEAHNKLGVALADRGALDEAMRHYSEAVRLKPWLAEAHNNLANALVKRGDTDEAIREYQAAIRARADYGDPHNGLGALLADQGKLDEAIEQYREALRVDPKNAEAMNNLATAFTERGQLDAAIEQLSAAIRTRPERAEFRFNLALVLDRAGRTSEAVPQIEQVLKIRPGDPAASNALAEFTRRLTRR